MKKDDAKIKQILELSQRIKKMPLSTVERELLDSTQRFEATFYSNKLEGNKLTKSEAQKAVL